MSKEQTMTGLERFRELLRERNSGWKLPVRHSTAEAFLAVAVAAQDARWDMDDGPAFRKLQEALARLDEELGR